VRFGRWCRTVLIYDLNWWVVALTDIKIVSQMGHFFRHTGSLKGACRQGRPQETKERLHAQWSLSAVSVYQPSVHRRWRSAHSTPVRLGRRWDPGQVGTSQDTLSCFLSGRIRNVKREYSRLHRLATATLSVTFSALLVLHFLVIIHFFTCLKRQLTLNLLQRGWGWNFTSYVRCSLK